MPRRLLSDRKKTFTKNFSFGDSFNYTNFLNDNQEGGGGQSICGAATETLSGLSRNLFAIRFCGIVFGIVPVIIISGTNLP